jgi:cyclic beta-1,2-glucan synthetase
MRHPFRLPGPPAPEEPIRAELFGVERLEQHATSLAAAQPVRRDHGWARLLLSRVADNARVLGDAYQAIAAAAREGQPITPAAEWLLENFHVIDEQLREIRDDLPAGFYRELPKLSDGPLTDYPRVYGIAWAFVAHTDSRFDPEMLRRFVRAYQRVQVLTIGELWAVAITLRIVLVENLRRLAEVTLASRAAAAEADTVADDLLGLGERAADQAMARLHERDRSPLVTMFAVRLIERLRDLDPASSPGVAWLHQRLAAEGKDPASVVQAELQRQAALTVTARNIITSMRLMSALDWADFFESVSLVDDELRSGTNFGAMDFGSRDSYRHAIEELARRSPLDELAITREVVAQTKASSPPTGVADAWTAVVANRRADPGYYLIGPGRDEFERTVRFKPSFTQRLLRLYIKRATPGYLGTIFVVTAAVLFPPLALAHLAGATVAALVLLGLLGSVPASDIAITLVNRWVASVVPPRLLARLELVKNGVPPELRTMVVVPTLLTTARDIEEQIERLEVHFLANADGHVHFALLTDWTDALQPTLPGDDEKLAIARQGIARLNTRHGPAVDGSARFLLLHRERRWNAAESRWMGWERKRGKLRELNRLLRGATDTSFQSPADVPRDVRFVVALDADTRMPIGTVSDLVGTIAHPLNRPAFDAGTGRVTSGFGVLQPRITPPLPMGDGSLFQEVISGPAGIDPYAAAVSDVYQDLFDEGSYTGKGVYDVDAFECALGDRVPENTLLSHDLFEGVCARAGLITDVELFEAAPANYLVAAARQHRWARGDWQLLPLIFKFRLPLIARWKMLDNLRRTLVAPASFLTLVLAMTLPATDALAWTILVLTAIALPAFMPMFANLLPRTTGISKRSHLQAIGRDFRAGALQSALGVSMLAHQAWLMTDAILRTLGRVYVTRRHLLEWLTAAQVAAGHGLDRLRFLRSMAGAMVLAVVAEIVIELRHPESWPLALPFVALWLVSPIVAHGISVPRRLIPIEPLSAAQARELRLIARRTWRFFATFVGAEDNHLPADNFQETPAPVVAHRTSPTNIGLYLLSAVAANDFGWVGIIDTVDRLDASFATLRRLERMSGHFFNWYDTTTVRPLEPRYLSSVDSGNLAGTLITLAGACDEMLGRPPLHSRFSSGIADTVALLRRAEAASATEELPESRHRFRAALQAVVSPVGSGGSHVEQWVRRLTATEAAVRDVAALAREFTSADAKPHSADVLEWVWALQHDVASHARDLDTLLPWARRAASASRGEPEPSGLPSLGAMQDWCALQEQRIRARASGTGGDDGSDTDGELAALQASASACAALAARIRAIAEEARAMVKEMDFTVLFDPVRQLFSIGYRVGDSTLDPGLYDLLASEARLASFVAIAKGDVPVSHWFHLGRALTPVETDSVLVSWSGSMFEYLMPSLVMQVPKGSLLDQTCRLVVRRQVAYGEERGVPWGVSESGYNVRDIAMTYQYSTFGVPGLGLRRQPSEDLVIAPYATALVALVDPAVAAHNLRRLIDAGGSGPYGLYEALDYTPSRVPAGARAAVVRSYMAHHQGMILLSLADALLRNPMRKRFHAEPMVRASELLLQERTPRDVAVARPQQLDEGPELREVRDSGTSMARRFSSPHGAVPRAHLLSNGQYAVMVTAAGAGYSRWRDLAVTRWREDATCDAAGSWIFLRDIATGAVWSAGYQPTGAEADDYSVAFSEDRAEFVRRDGPIGSRLEIIVSPEDDAEVRRVSLSNYGLRSREIEITSYAEIVLAPQAADVAHPAFSDLFVHTECLADRCTLLATRRPRAADEAQPWCAHVMAVDGTTVGSLQWETDRARFLGRGRTARDAQAVSTSALTGTVGPVLHPVMALRQRVRIGPGGQARITLSTMVAASRERVLELADKYRESATFDRAADLAWTQAQVQLHHLGVSPDEAHVFQTLAGALIYSDRALRPSGEVLAALHGGRPALWAHGISGDLPIVVVQVDEIDDLVLVRQMLRAHEFWRMKHLDADLVILNEHGHSYLQDLQNALDTLVRASRPSAAGENRELRGGVFALRADLLPAGDRGALMHAARVVVSARRGTLAEQVLRTQRRLPVGAALPARRTTAAPVERVVAPRDLRHFNGIGGFSADGREYVIILTGDTRTPAPWINVISNAEFGFQVSESGSGYTWSVNSHENQLTPWSNDSVSDPAGEAIYVRDMESGETWTATALPIRETERTYIARHGQGYSRFEHVAHQVSLELLQLVPLRDPVKISRLTLTNQSGRRRRLSVTAFAEWVLGASRGALAPFVVTEVDKLTGIMLARNAWNQDFRERIAFADLGGAQISWTGDRTEFFGRNGTADRPAALEHEYRLSGRVGAGFDPCAALQTVVDLAPGASATVTFLLGEAGSRDEAIALGTRYRGEKIDELLAGVVAHWEDVLGAVQVETPDSAMNLMLNRWLLYQTLACRVLARSAFYQASGAYGFRDQLQDVMALAIPRPDTTRAQLLRAAARQFPEGDVQHWWHPTTGRGLRTRMSDDLLWLPYVATHFLKVTADATVLDATAPFLEGARLAATELECYFQPRTSEEQFTLYEHCARAIDHSLAVGSHGLPLIGTGDWNDGMNRVGIEGKGESVWLGWFLYRVLSDWAPIAGARGESERSARWLAHAAQLREALQRDAWDGQWYRRAYFDDGTPLGSRANDECQIDAIAQSWSVLSGAGDPERSRQALGAVDKYLIRRRDQLHLLLTPPFDKTPLDPGYIKGYLPGVRENGGQYTHAAVWSIVAFAMLGDGDRAGELFNLINPVRHAESPDGVQRYQVEPYVVAGDVYSETPHVGRGGWTWYTGAAGWLYRAGLESILGFSLRGQRLVLDPCIPREWDGFSMVFRYHATRYEIAIENRSHVSRGVVRLELDGAPVAGQAGVGLQDDHAVHRVRVVMGNVT